MNHDQMIEAKIEELFRQRPWGGVISLEEAIAYAIAYRRGLSETDRQVYDKQILLGRHPSKAMETVEIVSGREPSKTGAAPAPQEATVLKVS